MSYRHTPHPHITARTRTPPTMTTGTAGSGTVRRPGGFNERLALAVTRGVGTMTCAYAFAALALVSLPASVATGDPLVIVSWIAQTFLQLVLLSVLMIGGNIATATADARDERTFLDAEAILHTTVGITEHLTVQDAATVQVLAALGEHSEALAGLHTRLDWIGRARPVLKPPAALAGTPPDGTAEG